MTTTLVHVGVAATDLDRSLAFWRDTLALTVVDSRPGIEVLSDGAHNITVFEYRGDRPANPPGHQGYLHIGVQVDDLAAALARCLAAGYEIVCDDIDRGLPYDPANPPTESFKVQDPDGIVVDITANPHQWLGVSPHQPPS